MAKTKEGVSPGLKVGFLRNMKKMTDEELAAHKIKKRRIYPQSKKAKQK